MMQAKHKTVSLADRVFEKLETDIIFGNYKQGEVLTELRLVEELGVSRTPIREALRRLQQERLIFDTGKGSVVQGITHEDLKDILDIRESAEALATYYATQNATQEGLDELRHIVELQEFYVEKGDAARVKEMDDQFHGTICELSQHQVITDTLAPLHRKIQNYRRASMADADRAHAAAREHRAILEAMEKRDAEGAKQLAVKHIQHAAASILGKGEK